MENKRGNCEIAGMGTATGGTYEDIIISGTGKVTGDIICHNYKSSGRSKVMGSIEAENISTSGSSTIEGNVKCKKFTISGACTVGNVISENFIVSGAANVMGSITSQEIKISGILKLSDNCESEIFESSGGFNIKGLLNAGKIKVDIGGKCVVKEVGGETIDIRARNEYGISKLIKDIMNQNKFFADIIEGDDIYLENTVVDIVRGSNIVIGDGCVIKNIEYKNELNVSPNAKVDKNSKI